MRSTTYVVPPNVAVNIQSAGALRLLSHVLGDAARSPTEPAIILRLGAEAHGSQGSGAPQAREVAGVYKAMPWKCKIAPGAEGSWSIAFSSVLYREYLALHIALLPALRRLLLDRGAAMAIGTAFAHDGGATVVTGTTGRGKTSLLLGALERGADFIGDEYIGLHEAGDVTPIIRSLALRRATLSLSPRMHERLSANRRATLRLAEAAAFVSRGFLQPLVHVPPTDLIDRPPVPAARLRRLFLLEAGDAVACATVDPGAAVEHLATQQSLHDVAYGDLGTFLGSAPYPERWREIAARALDGVACQRLSIPPRGDIPREALDLIMEPGP